MNEEQARARIEELRGYYGHLASYVAVMLFLFFLDMWTGPGWWFVWPLFGWGIGLMIHTVTTFFAGSDWEQRKMEQLTGLKQTQDELGRLSERMDNLVAILSSINWAHIDPELVKTRDSLEAARSRLDRLEREGGTADQAELAREIEKLEAFVTSPGFDFVDRAQHPPS